MKERMKALESEPMARRKEEVAKAILEYKKSSFNDFVKTLRPFSSYSEFSRFAAKHSNDIVIAFDAARKDAVSAASSLAEDSFKSKTNRQHFAEAVGKLCNDSFSLIYSMVLMEGKDLDRFAERIDGAISQKSRNLLSFFKDYQDLTSANRYKDRMIETLDGFSKEIPSSVRQDLDNLKEKIVSGKYDSLIDQIVSIYSSSKIGEIFEFQPYFMINYRENAFFDMSSLILLNHSNKKIDDRQAINLFSTSSSEWLFMYPVLFVPTYGADEYIKFVSGKPKPETIPQKELSLVLSDMKIWNDVPMKDQKFAMWQVGNITDQLMGMPSANMDLANKSANGELPYLDMEMFIFKRMVDKKVSPVIDVIPSGIFLTDQDKRRMAMSSRTVQLGINDSFLEFDQGKTILSFMHSWYDRTRIKNKMECLGATDGSQIFIYPYYSKMPTKDLNVYLLFNIMRHEVGHIKDGSFNYELGAVPKIDLMAPLEPYKERYKEPEVKALQSFIEQVMQDFDARMTSLKKTKEPDLGNVFDALRKSVNVVSKKPSFKDDENVKKFESYASSTMFNYVSNVIDDHRIDKRFYDGKGVDEAIDSPDTKDVDTLRNIYRVATYMRALPHSLSIRNNFKEDRKASNATQTLFMKAMLDNKSFNDILGESVDPLFRDICNHCLSRGFHGERRMNETLSSSLEFIAYSVLFEEYIKPPVVKLGGKGKGAGGSGTPGEKGESEETPESSEKQKGKPEKSDDDKDPSSELDDKADDIIDKREAGKVTIHDKKSEDKEGKISEKKKDTTSKRMTLNSKDVELFKQFFLDLRVDKMRVFKELGKRGSRVDINELVKFMHKRGAAEPRFLEKRDYTKTQGTHLESRPIDIYIGIDTSGSMSGERVLNAEKISLTLLAAYNEVRREMVDANIHMHMISVASSGSKTDMVDWDATDEIRVEKSGSQYNVHYKFVESGGGTDLPEMIKAFQGKVEDIKKETVKSIVKGKKALNPSILLIYMTDFGDNAGDVEGVVSAAKGFGEFAKKYRADSKTIHLDSNEAGLGSMFIVPSDDSDNDNIKNATSMVLDGCVTHYTGENPRKVLDILKKLIPVLAGEKATNVKTE